MLAPAFCRGVGTGAAGPPQPLTLTNLVGKVRMWWDLLVKATPAAPWSSHPTLRFDPSKWGVQGSKAGGLWGAVVSTSHAGSKKLQIPAPNSLWVHDSTRGELWGLGTKCYWTKSQNHLSWKALPGSWSLFNPSLPCQLNQSTEGQSKH